MQEVGDELFPTCTCPHCNKITIIGTENYYLPDTDIKFTLAWCPHCDNVLNLEEDFKCDWMTEKQLAELGWQIEEEGEI